MRVKYTGKDQRTRIATANRFKFIPNELQHTDPRNERDEEISGPLIIFHTYRTKGGKRTILSVPRDFDFQSIQQQILENGWVDLSMYPSVSEFYY